jgi:hypothetical protein
MVLKSGSKFFLQTLPFQQQKMKQDLPRQKFVSISLLRKLGRWTLSKILPAKGRIVDWQQPILAREQCRTSPLPNFGDVKCPLMDVH